MVRPEETLLAPSRATSGIALPVTVVERTFLGATNTYQVVAAGQPAIEIRQPLGQAGGFTPEVGAQVLASVAPDRCHVFRMQ